MLIRHGDIRVLSSHLVDRPRPQGARVLEHVVLVHQCQVLAAGLGTLEGVAHHTLDPEPSVEADLGGHLVRGVDTDRAAVAGIRALGALAHHDQVDGRVPRQRAGDTGVQLGRAQIDVVVQREAGVQQQPPLQHTAGDRRIANGAKQNGVVSA
ncbi:Uncharacterised protein [Mycobacteroides abscessus subsp. abscessus]|nr:Uncharacterised protein [Mycobacteroides abscessus subsp. abscessus]